MLLDKALILKGIAGLAALGGGVGGTFVFRKELGIVKDSSTPEDNPSPPDVSTDPKTDAPTDRQNVDNTADDHSNQQQHQQLPQENKREHLGLPESCKWDETSPKTCSITLEELKKVDFSNKGTDDLTIEGQSSGNITLVIEKITGDDTTYPNGKKYTFKGFTETTKIKVANSKDNVITMEKNSDNLFVEKNRKLEKIPSEILSKEEIKTLNEKLQDLVLPNDCNFNEKREVDEPTAIVCNYNDGTEEKEIDKLNKIKFSDKTDNKELEAGEDESLENLQLKIKKLINEEKSAYGENLEGDLLFTFQLLEETIKWKNEPKTTFLAEGSNTEFKLSGGKLSKLWSPTSLGQKVGLTCQDSNKECSITSPLNFKKNKKHHKNQSLSSISNKKFKFTKDEESYNQGFKYTYEGDGVTSGSFTLNNNDKFEIKYEKDNGWYLSHKS